MKPNEEQDMKIQEKIEEALENVIKEYNIYVEFVWDYIEVI